MKRFLLLAMVVVSLSSCMGWGGTTPKSDGVSLSEREEFRYNNAAEALAKVESLMQQCEQDGNADSYAAMLSQARALQYEYDTEGMNEATIEHCNQLKERVLAMQSKALAFVEAKIVSSGRIGIYSHDNLLMSARDTKPFYLNAGEKLFIEHTSSEAMTIRLNNADTQRALKTYTSAKVKDSIKIAYSGIYTIDLLPKSKCYSSLKVEVRPLSSEAIYDRKSVQSETVECSKGDWGAKAVKAIKMHNCFEDPRKLTLRGQLKAMFSGNSKALVAVQVPAGTTDILYSVRIATSEQSHYSDGEFHNNLSYTYKQIKLLGLPFYEKEKTRGVFVRLLDDNRPIREEDAYCNMYVFRSKAQAKQFQDGTKSASQLSYDVDYSTIGTQSCNGRIPMKEARTIYLGFENERMRYVNYLWVEVVAVTPTTEYYTTKYSVN